MGRAILNLILSILAMLLVASGVVLVVAHGLSRNDQLFARLLDWMQRSGPSPAVLVGGVVLLVLGALLFFISLSNSPEPRTFRFSTDFGDVGISLSALEDFVARHAKGLSMVESARPTATVSPDGKRLRLNMSTSVVATGSLKNVSEAVQEAVVHAIRDGLGLTEIETIDVDVTRITTPKGGLPTPPQAISGEAEEEPAMLGAPAPAETEDADEAHHPVS